MAEMPIQLIVGLGNPGPKYRETRHNAGFWFVEALADKYQFALKNESKFDGLFCQTSMHGAKVGVLLPQTYMNLSGQAVAKVAKYYKIPTTAILVIHDELDFEVGTIRLKQNGGHGGHNGLRDIINHLHGNDFWRLRVGISHPGSSHQVLDYVLQAPSKDDRISIDRAIDEGIAVIPEMLQGHLQKALTRLHSE